MPISDWPARWDALRRACAKSKATGRWEAGRKKPPRFEIGPPATEHDVAAIESILGRPIPLSLRKVLLEFSANVCIEWQLPDRRKRPDAFREIFAGECRWNLQSLLALESTYCEWLQVFTDPTDKYDGPWQNKFAILEVGNGDMVTIDASVPDPLPVVYLSHEGDDSVHGYWLGRDFEDYVDRLSLLGCVGAEAWQMKPFVSGPRSLLETEGLSADEWRNWFGLRFP